MATAAEITSTCDPERKNHCIRIPLLNLGQNAKTPLIPWSDFQDAYTPFQALHIRGFDPVHHRHGTNIQPAAASSSFQASDVQSLFGSLNKQDTESWCIENKSNISLANKEGNKKINEHDEKVAEATPIIFLDIHNNTQRGYCSFLVQHSKDVMKELLLNRLPMVDLPVEEKNQCTDSTTMKVHYGPCLWFFFGKNKVNDTNGLSKATSEDTSTAPSTLLGRPEHTDAVTHDGTWHYQLSGTKIWRLRPTNELIHRMKEYGHEKEEEDQQEGDVTVVQVPSEKKRKLNVSRDDHKKYCNTDNDCIEVECKQGDILLLNTRLWWHSTLIPPQDVPCISYARDIYFPSSEVATGMICGVVANAPGRDENGEENESNTETSPKNQKAPSSMTNIDGTYAADDIEASTILFTEHTMPDCELHRSKTNPNCQLVELDDEETGESYMAIVSLRDIKAGEFFCILESDDEDDDDDDDEDEGQWEEDEEDEKE